MCQRRRDETVNVRQNRLHGFAFGGRLLRKLCHKVAGFDLRKNGTFANVFEVIADPVNHFVPEAAKLLRVHVTQFRREALATFFLSFHTGRLKRRQDGKNFSRTIGKTGEKRNTKLHEANLSWFCVVSYDFVVRSALCRECLDCCRRAIKARHAAANGYNARRSITKMRGDNLLLQTTRRYYADHYKGIRVGRGQTLSQTGARPIAGTRLA